MPTVSSLFYAVLTCVVRCFSFLRRFHLCSADTCSLFYVVFTYVVPTLLRFLMSFLPMSFSYVIFTCVVPTLLRFLTSFSPMLCRYFFAFLCHFHLCRFLMSFSFGWCRYFFAFLRRFYLHGANASSLSYVVFASVVPILLFLMSFSPM